MTTTFIDEKRTEIRARLDEIKPLVDEFHQLVNALEALNGAGVKTTNDNAPRRGRPKGTGTRAAECIAWITKEPGLTAGEIAEKIGINQNYLYRVLPNLEQDGKIEKRGRGWYIPEAK